MDDKITLAINEFTDKRDPRKTINELKEHKGLLAHQTMTNQINSETYIDAVSLIDDIETLLISMI